MNCNQAVEFMQCALDADPSALPPTEVARHIEECEDCRRVWDELREVEALVSRLHTEGEVEPPRSLHAGVMDAVARRGRSARVRRVRPARAGLLWAVAAAAFLGAAVILHGVFTGPDRSPERGGIAQLEQSLSVAALSAYWPGLDLKEARNRIIREALAPERLTALAGKLPLPGLAESAPTAPVPGRSEINWSAAAVDQFVPGEVTDTVKHLWDSGASTLRFLAGDRDEAPENHI